MQHVAEDTRKRVIRGREIIRFTSFSSYHLIIVAARAKGEKQLSDSSTDDEELTVQIDDKTFPKLGSSANSVLDSPAAINGGKLHNLTKTVYFLTYLSGKYHELTLATDDLPGTASFESLEIYTFNSVDKLTLEPKIQAEDGDRREWIAFVLDNFPLKQVDVTITYTRRKRDSDDVKILLDDKVQGNILRDIKHFLWHFVGSFLPQASATKTETQVFVTNFLSGLHYVEINADRMPTLDKITFSFGHELSVPKRLPTINDPEWTGNFDDDTKEMLMARLILGEAERQPKETKIGVGFTVLNRLKKQNPNWGGSIREIILKEEQYDGMWNKNTYEKVRNPFSDTSESRRREWAASYEVAVGVLSGNLSDTTSGATNFHSFEDPRDFPVWATKETFKIKLGKIYFYELEK